jgi:small GTP-binding protein
MGQKIKLKLIVLGDEFSGKSSILHRYKNKDFILNNSSTIGVDFVTSIINHNNNEYTLHIWDTSGQEKFDSIIVSYYRNIAVAIIVFDLSNIESFNNIKKWFTNIDYYCNKDITIKLIGNKCDQSINVNQHDINLLCRDYNVDYFEVSAKDNINIDSVFENIVEDIDNKLTNCDLVPSNKNGIMIVDIFKLESNDIQKIKKPKEPKCCTIL